MAKKRLRKGEGRIQFIACRERIEELQAQGYDILAIHSTLVKEKRISMSYAGFYENITQRRKKSKVERNHAMNRADGKKPKSGALAPKRHSGTQDKSLEAFSATLAQAQASKPPTRGRDGEYSEEELF